MKLNRIILSSMIAFLAIATLTLSCDKKKPEATNLEVNPSTIEFTAEGGKMSIDVTTNATSVEVKLKSDWVTGTYTDKKIEFRANANESQEARSVVADIVAGDVTKQVTINQLAQGETPTPDPVDVELSLDPDMVEFGEEGGIANITVKTNGDKSKVVVEGEASWLTVNYSDGVIALQAQTNASFDTRYVALNVTLDDAEASLLVNQSGKAKAPAEAIEHFNPVVPATLPTAETYGYQSCDEMEYNGGKAVSLIKTVTTYDAITFQDEMQALASEEIFYTGETTPSDVYKYSKPDDSDRIISVKKNGLATGESFMVNYVGIILEWNRPSLVQSSQIDHLVFKYTTGAFKPTSVLQKIQVYDNGNLDLSPNEIQFAMNDEKVIYESNTTTTVTLQQGMPCPHPMVWYALTNSIPKPVVTTQVGAIVCPKYLPKSYSTEGGQKPINVTYSYQWDEANNSLKVRVIGTKGAEKIYKEYRFVLSK